MSNMQPTMLCRAHVVPPCVCPAQSDSSPSALAAALRARSASSSWNCRARSSGSNSRRSCLTLPRPAAGSSRTTVQQQDALQTTTQPQQGVPCLHIPLAPRCRVPLPDSAPGRQTQSMCRKPTVPVGQPTTDGQQQRAAAARTCTPPALLLAGHFICSAKAMSSSR